MKAAWDWHHPRTTEQDERDLVSLVSDIGFDTLVVNNPTALLHTAARDCGITLIAVLSPYADDEFCSANTGCLQKMLPFEEHLAADLGGDDGGRLVRVAHRWYPYLQRGNLLCYDQEESFSYLRKRIDALLDEADGIALDGFGYKNHYACFCDHCRKRHGTEDPELIAKLAEDTLIESSRTIYNYIKVANPDNIAMNHIWPPFEPNLYYGSGLYLDYCSQTISWFYRPLWSLEHVEFESVEHRRLQMDGRNQFVPFIGYSDESYHRRSADRLGKELAIGLEYGDGNIVFCTLQGPIEDPEIKDVLRRYLSKDKVF